MKQLFTKTWLRCKFAVLLLCAVIAFAFPSFTRNTHTVKADEPYFQDPISILEYDVDMTVQTDRKVRVTENITVLFLRSGLSMFYRSLPTENAKYSNISASCAGNTAFSYYVADNPDMDGFIDVNCVGGVAREKIWTYTISYTMQNGLGGGTKKDGMIVDIIGYGWSVPLNYVNVAVHFPAPVTDYKFYVGEYGASQVSVGVEYALSEDKKTFTASAEHLDRVYNDTYQERMAKGMTLDFTLSENALKGYVSTRLFTEKIAVLILFGGMAIAIAVLLRMFTRKKRELVTVVSVKPPEGFDPLKMGRYIDGAVDDEDLTSMIYYFADKGYLRIDLTDEKDPVLIACVDELPQDAPTYQKTLFDGLFKEAKSDENGKAMRISALSEKYFNTTQKAKAQLPDAPPMYEKRSVLGYVFGAISALLTAFLSCRFMGRQMHESYSYVSSLAFILPIVLIAVLGYVRENYRFKWKKKTFFLVGASRWLIALLFSLMFVGLFAKHIMTEYERILVCVSSFFALFLTQGILSRTQKYVDSLREILGFKEFIVYTEEDKIQFMLEENPELFYHILPYAQVLGVTNEWENKFKKLLIAPPSWCTCDVSVFDYLIIRQCVRASMLRAFVENVSKKASQGGSFIGRSGGGGGFGSFGGGGFGGGGGGAR